MRPRIAQISAFVAGLSVMLGAHPSYGKCARRPNISESLDANSYVFVGRVIFDLSSPDRQQVLVHPLTWYKGNSAAQPLLVVRNAEPPFACATHFALGDTYLFFSETPVAPWIHEVRACDPNQAAAQLSSQDWGLLARY